MLFQRFIFRLSSKLGTSPRALTENKIVEIIREAGRIPAACDCNYNILHTFGMETDEAPRRLEDVPCIPY